VCIPHSNKTIRKYRSSEIDTFTSIRGDPKQKMEQLLLSVFSDDIYRGIIRAEVNYGIEIRKITVKDLIESKKMV
jgi:hypothetical protein